MNKQIGYYNLSEDKIFRNTFECAAWREDVLVKAGKYPVFVRNFEADADGKITGSGTFTRMDGVINSDYFAGQYCGVPISDYDTAQNAGKPASHTMMEYIYAVADSILNDENSPWELLPEYEARAFEFEYCGEHIKHCGIFERIV